MKILLLFAMSLIGTKAGEPLARQFEGRDGMIINYRFVSPDTLEDGKKYPIILFLHGSGERGSDNEAQLKHGVSDILKNAEELGEPIFLIAPQCPADITWSPPGEGKLGLKEPEKTNPLLAGLLNLIEELSEKNQIDQNRIYVTGLSLGGFGTFDLLARAPERWAAAIPICGGGNADTVDRFKDVPLKIVHGEADRVVPYEASQIMFDALKKAGAEDIELISYPGVAHDSWTQTYANKEMIKWLLDQRKE